MRKGKYLLARQQLTLAVGGPNEPKITPRKTGFNRGTLVALNDIAYARRIGSFYNWKRPGVVVDFSSVDLAFGRLRVETITLREPVL